MHLFKEGEHWKVEPGPLGVETLVVNNIKKLYFHQRNLQKENLKVMYYKDFIKLVEGNPTTRMLTKSKTQQTGNISADRGTDEKKNRASR